MPRNPNDLPIVYKIQVRQRYEVTANAPQSADEVLDELSRQFDLANKTADNEFWENADVICRECGLTLGRFDENSERKFDSGLCSQCQHKYDERHPDDVKIV